MKSVTLRKQTIHYLAPGYKMIRLYKAITVIEKSQVLTLPPHPGFSFECFMVKNKVALKCNSSKNSRLLLQDRLIYTRAVSKETGIYSRKFMTIQNGLVVLT